MHDLHQNEEFVPFSEHNGSLLRRQPGANAPDYRPTAWQSMHVQCQSHDQAADSACIARELLTLARTLHFQRIGSGIPRHIGTSISTAAGSMLHE